MSLNPLKTLSLTGRYAELPLSEVFEHHGPNLQTLLLHQRETTDLENLRDGLSIKDLKNMQKFCPKLEDVTIDLSRSATNPGEREIISNLAALPNLTRVGINLDLGIAEMCHHSPFSKLPVKRPNVAESEIYNDLDNSATVIWTMLREEREKKGLTLLKELDLKVGELREMGGGHPASWVIW